MALRDFSHSLPMLLYRALDAVMPRFRRIFNAHGLTEQQWRVLRVLGECAPLPLNALAEHTLIAAPSLVGVVERLRRDGLVERHRSAEDRRVVTVSLTPRGREVERAVGPEIRAAYSALLQSMPAPDWVRLVELLEQIPESGNDA